MFTYKVDPVVCLFLFQTVGQLVREVTGGHACAGTIGFGTKLILIVPERGRSPPQYTKWPMTMILVFDDKIVLES